MAKMELTEEQWQKLGQHLPQNGDFFVFSAAKFGLYAQCGSAWRGVKFANAGLSAAD